MKTLKDIFDEFLEYRAASGYLYKHNHSFVLKHFIRFCKEELGCTVISQLAIDKWCSEDACNGTPCRKDRVASIRALVLFSNSMGYTRLKYPAPYKANRETMTELPLRESAVKWMIEKYLHFYNLTHSKLCGTTHKNLVRFNNYCSKSYPGTPVLTDEMVNGWCSRRDTESSESRNTRVLPIRMFLKHAVNHGWTSVSVPETLVGYKERPRQPHGFTHEDLMLFFEGTDSLAKNSRCDFLGSRIAQLQPPVYFRLLYSTGMRTNEARELRRDDVDLATGIINIRQTKGNGVHRVALHPSMHDLLKKYDEAMNRLMPDRTVFFPNERDSYHSISWQASYFRRIWSAISTEDARAYDFRSHYAVANINSWEQKGPEWLDKLLYLSRSMGHTKIESTCYYFQLTPMFGDLLEKLTSKGIKDITPNLTDFFNYEDEQ